MIILKKDNYLLFTLWCWGFGVLGETISPEQLGFTKCKQEELSGGSTVEESAKILIDVLNNKGTKAQTEVILANAAIALYSADNKLSLSDAVLKAKESLESGKAFECFNKFIS